jgi:MscS family membrane protein
MLIRFSKTKRIACDHDMAKHRSRSGWIRPICVAFTCFLLLFVVLLPIAVPQTFLSKRAAPAKVEAAPSPTPLPPALPPDSLVRETPRGTVLGFLSAVQRGNFEQSENYLEVPGNDRVSRELPNQLAYILNRLRQRDLSNQVEGSSQPNVPHGIERIQTVTLGDDSLNIDLHRVNDGKHWIWIFSAQTLAKVPSAYAYLNESSFERHLPAFLKKPLWLLIPLWKYLALVVGFILALAATYAIGPSLRRLLLRGFPTQSEEDGHKLVKRLGRPLTILVWLALTELMVVAFALPLLARELWHVLFSKIAVAVIAWLILAVINVAALAYRWRMEQQGRADITAVVRLGQRTVNLLCIFIGAVVVLHTVGYNVSALLTGLGIGGVAIAFAAQKSLENVFGGISVILDKPIRVGDECLIGDKRGVVMDIGLRSTRIRTRDRTVMTVPNGELSTMTLENISMRDMIWFHHVLSVRMESAVNGLEPLLKELRALLAEHPLVNSFTHRVRLTRLDAQALDIEMFCHIETRLYIEFLDVQESLLLQTLRILDAHRAFLASPIKTIDLAQRNKLDLMVDDSANRAQIEHSSLKDVDL